MKHTFTNLLTRLCANTPPCFGKRSSHYLFSLLVILTLGVGNAWGANGDVLFSQDFSGTGSLTYTQNVALTKTSGLTGIVGDAANLFTSVTTSNKNSTGIAINHATAGGNSTDATGFFQAYFNNTSGYWSAIRTNDLAGTAPTAIKFSMDIWFNNLSSSSSATLVNIAVGDGFTESLKSSSAEAADLVHSGWGITVESSPKLCAYNTYGTKIYNTALSYSKWYSITWVINNTGETLTHNNPTGTGTTTLANDKYDIWLKETSQGASSYTKVASAISATTASKALQELYFGHVAGKKHEFRLDNLVITDLTPASGDPSCEATANAGADKNTTVGVGVAMAATAAGEGYTGAWSIKAGSPSAATSQLGTTSSNTMTFTPNTYGTYTLVWTVTDNNDGTCSDSDEATVTVPAPTHGILYTNLKGMDNSANPTSYSEGTGVASFAKLRHAVGYDFTGWSPSSISSSATTDQTIEAQWTANAVAEGTGTLTYALGYSDNTITTSSITRDNGALYDATDLAWTGVTIDDSESAERSGKITTTDNYNSGKYLSLTFKIADGYTFIPSEVQLKAVAVSSDKTIRFEFTDNAETPNTKYLEQVRANGSSVGTLTYDFDASDPVTLTGTVTVKIYAYGATNSWRLGTPITITGTVAEIPSSDCSAYEFHYGPEIGDWETACFTQVGETNEWRIADFTVPSTGNYYVGYHGNGVNGWNSDWSATKSWTDSYSDGNGAMVLLPGTSAVGQATNATGTLIIWSNSGDKNKYVGFKPDGYGITYGGSSHAFAATATDNVLETEVVTLPAVSTTYTMGLATATAGTYVACAHSSAAEAISNMSVSNIDGGKKKVYLYTTDEGWLASNPKMAVYDYTNSRNYWGDNTDANKFMTKVNDNLWYGYVQSDATNLIMVRVNPENAEPAWDWGQSHDITLNAADSYDTYITLTGWSDGKATFTKGFAHPATGQKGKFRMYDNSGDQNWYVHFVPYYTLSYDANGGSNTMPATERSSESSTLTVTVAANAFTAPEGYTFDHWNTANDNSGENFAAAVDFTLTSNATLYAIWKLPAPTITCNSSTGLVTITAVDGATIKYSLDGSDPASGTTYSEAFTIDEDKTVKAIAIKSGYVNSEVASKNCVLCAEPATLTNEIARFFVPCGTTSGYYNVTDQASSTGDNTFTTDGFGNSWEFKETGWAYGKLNGNSNYIEITLNSGTFKAGDVVYGYFSSNSANNNLKLHASDGNALGAASASGLVDGEYVRSLTLAAADIEEGGSIKFFRAESAIRVNRIIVTREPPCVGEPGDISKGTLSAGVLTLNAAGSPVSGDTWYWQSSASGTDQTNSGTSYGVSAAGTYYVRSYNATGTCWSEAKSITVTAEDLVESFTVVYKDGETTLGSENVEVGEHPTATGITTTKEFYTFAAWQESGVDKALNTVSAANGETVTLTAHYTGNYAYGTYLFNSLTMGSTISKTITAEEVVYDDAFRVDNFYFAAGIKIQGEVGTAEETTTLANYKGWKLKTDTKTIRFLVENNSQVKVAIGEKTGIQVTYTPLVGAETTVAQVKDNETAYSVKGGTIVTITTTSNNTTTLKRLSISNLYNVTYTDGTGDASGSASNVAEVTLPTPTETIVTVETIDYSFTGWKANQAVTVNDVAKSAGTLLNAGDVAVLGANTTFTAQWAVVTPKYAITKGTHTNGDFTISVAEQEAGGAVTLTATPDEDYVFSAWAVVKTEDGSATGITVSNNTFTMPAYGVTVNATFAADPRQKVLYVTATAEETVKANDKLYAALKDTYNVKIVGPDSDADQSDYALVVLHESLNGGNDYNNTAVAAAKIGNVPVLNTKAYFYNSGRFGWGTPNAGKSVKGATLNSAYCNIADHPLFNDVTVSEGFFEITDDAAAKCMQPVGSFTSGKEGYILATTPNAESGNGCAIHELTPTQRGASAGKYLMISVSNDKLNALNANGQKLFQNAAAYLIGSTAWEPINVLTSPAVTASPSTAYFVGDNIALTASATGVSAATTYTWYKGDTWSAAEEAGAIQAAKTAAEYGNIFGVSGCALGDAGTYWCVISNGADCEVSVSLAITVSNVSYDITFVSAHGTAPSATTGVSYTLPELTASGWEHQGWTANINVEVDAETVTAGTTIANGKIATFAADVTFTAVWTQVFDVTFNLQDHGAAIDAQHILNGGKVTEPNDPHAIGWEFGGWFTDAECTEGNEFDFNTAISDDTELFAKWTAFTGCTELWPATSGDAPAAVGDAIVMQTGSNGASMTALAKPDKLSYTGSGLQFSSESGVKVKVVLNNDMTVGTKISLTLVANGGKTRGLNLYTKDADKINDFTCWVDGTNPASDGAEETFTYTVVADDGLDGTNEFQLWRNNTVCLKSLKVESCGAAVIYHDLTSAVDPTGKGTVTLGASSVREGLTTTATYSAIDEAYEFDEWQISGTGATLSSTTANPVTITMGTADAVVTLKLKAATPKHTVTFNKMGKGDDIDDQEVKEGDLVEEPTVTEPEGWILEGWYTENTFDTKWDFASDVMSTSDIELFANWVADTSIKLINKSTGAINTTNFATAVTATADVDGEKGATYSSARSAVTSVSALGEMVQYNATTNQTKIQLSMYNTSSNQKTIYLFKVAEGDAEADVTEINIDANSRLTTEYYTFNSDKNRSFYVTVSDTKVKILQMKVVEEGATPMKQFGQAGYSLNFNKGRMFAKNDDSAYPFEGGSIKVSSDYKVLNNSNLATKSYIQFTTTVNGMILRVTRAGGNYYVSQDPSEMGTTYSKNEDITLTTAGTWYIGSTSSGSSASFTKFEFIAPKCEAPAFNALTNSDICSGDPYVALDGTGTVSDGGSITYKWYAEGSEDVLGTDATYTPEADGNYFVVALHHVDGYTDNEATSDVVTVTTHAGTAITEALADQRGNVDAVVALEVAASGKNLHYAWKECATIDGEYTAVAGAADAASLNVTITEGMNKYYKVVVSSDCGANQESVAHVTQYVPVAQANVTGSIVWNWANAASVNEIKLTASTSPKKNEGFVMANGAATIYNNANFESDKLYLEGEYIVRNGSYFQGQTIKFNATVAGLIRVKFSHTGNDKPARELYINGVGTGDTRTSATAAWSRYVEVPAGEVVITAYHVDPADGAGQQYIRVPEIEFYALDQTRSDSWIAPGELGTVCYPNGHIVLGADMYQMAGVNENGKFAFDQVEVTEPGVPYLFEATGYDPIRFYKTTAATAAEAGTSNGMVGTFVEKTLSHTTDVNTYYFQGTHFYAVTDRTKDLTVPAYRCYVDLNESHPAAAPKAGVRRITFGVNGTNVVTDIENVQGDDVQCTKVLIDGKIYILRGEKMYDVTGKLVK